MSLAGHLTTEARLVRTQHSNLGRDEFPQPLFTVRVHLRSLTSEEVALGGARLADIEAVAYAAPDADVREGDKLEIDGELWRVFGRPINPGGAKGHLRIELRRTPLSPCRPVRPATFGAKPPRCSPRSGRTLSAATIAPNWCGSPLCRRTSLR